MKYNFKILTTRKAIIELIPENEAEKALLNAISEDDNENFTLQYHYEME